MNKLLSIQQALKAPKSNTNNFAKYKYRTVSNILEEVKPLLAKHELAIVMTDEIVEVGGALFLKASVSLYEGDNTLYAGTTAYAQLDSNHSGMCNEQKTGAASTYARKYALCGLFAIDDSDKDVDALEEERTLLQIVAGCNTADDLNNAYKQLKGTSYKTAQQALAGRMKQLNAEFDKAENKIIIKA